MIIGILVGVLLLSVVPDSSGVGGIVGFVLLPLVMLIGAPWSFMFFDTWGAEGMVVVLAVGILANGAIAGAASGLSAKTRRGLRQSTPDSAE